MDDATIRHLNAINRRFYAAAADDFDATRQQPWDGWERLAGIVETSPLNEPSVRPLSTTWRGEAAQPIKPSTDAGVRLVSPLSVLDAGCGNGRFGVFLAERLGKVNLRYVGIDSSAALLERARAALAGIDAQFELRDLVEQPPDSSLGQFGLVALFGVLHHVPGAENRCALLRSLADRVAPGGLLAWTEWRFLENPRLVERIVPWDAGLQVEPGDYLLDWRRGAQAFRYCHAVDDAEHARLIAAAGLRVLDEYRADAANGYTVLQRQERTAEAQSRRG